MPKEAQYSDEAIEQIIEEMEKAGKNVTLKNLSSRISANRNRLHKILLDHQKKRLSALQGPEQVPHEVISMLQEWVTSIKSNTREMMSQELNEAMQRGEEISKVLAEKEEEIVKLTQGLEEAVERKEAAENERLVAEGMLTESQRTADEARKEQTSAEGYK